MRAFSLRDMPFMLFQYFIYILLISDRINNLDSVSNFHLCSIESR